MKFTVCNLGCKVNAYEAESISEALIQKGWQRAEEEDDVDAVLIFTCAVTNMAASKSRKQLHKAVRQHPHAVKVAAGCYAQLNDGLLQDADIIVGSSHKKDIPAYIDQYLQDHQKIAVLDDLSAAVFEQLPVNHFENHSRGVLKIQDGCNQFCSYCVIPYVRGRERSLAPDEVIQEAREIAMVHSEIVLTGIHTGRYGHEYGMTLAQLIQRILKEVPALKRLRISSIEVTELSDEFIELMKNEPRIARHLHIPLQSGCDAVLQKMNRPYDTKEYYDKIEHIREEIPEIAISCDVIVGFPGESDEMFEETYAFLKKCRFSFLHVFPYSLREGTLASQMPCQVDPQIKKERAARCTALSQQLSDAYQQSKTGTMAEVITELPEGDTTPGHTSDYIPVKILHQNYPRGTFVKVLLKEYSGHQMTAEAESVIKDETI
jgi:threonylcarbamoyladenosine tRNA methylthiotransferase MtaB